MKAYVKDNGVGWTIALDPGSVAALDFGTRGQPETLRDLAQRGGRGGEVRTDGVGSSSSTFLAAARQTG